MDLNDYIPKELRNWSLVHFLFDAFVSALLTYFVSLLLKLPVGQLIALGILVFGAVTSGMMLYRSRSQATSFQDVIELNRALDINRQSQSLVAAMRMLSEFTEAVPNDPTNPTHSELFKVWRSMVRSYLKGTCRPEIADEFEKRSRSATDYLGARIYLHGLINYLTRDDLRIRPGMVVSDQTSQVDGMRRRSSSDLLGD